MKRISIGVLLMLVAIAAFAQRLELLERWEAHDPSSTVTVDHSLWTELLERYLDTEPRDGVYRFDYGGVTASDRALLDDYLMMLESTPVSTLNRTEQYAFWLNVYNAFTVELIVDNYPVDSIRDIDISPGLFSNGPWGAALITVEGQPLTLDDVEHRILRPIWQDPRIHYGVNCASIGCPNLQPLAFTSENLEEMLNEGARAYVNHPRGASIERNRLTVSSIYNWFQIDFGDSEEGVIAHLLEYAEPDLARELRGFNGRVRYEYDWAINDSP